MERPASGALFGDDFLDRPLRGVHSSLKERAELDAVVDSVCLGF